MMFIKALLVSFPTAFALGETYPFGPLPCSSISGPSCRCPIGTNHSEIVASAIIGATAYNVGVLTNNFFNAEWLGLDLISQQGPNDFPELSIRDVNMTTSVGTYTFSERLIFRSVFPDGSFEQRYEQRGIVPYRSGNGSFSGYWVTLKSEAIFENETLVRLSNYACQTGQPIDYPAFQETALINAINILTARGLAPGISTSPGVA